MHLVPLTFAEELILHLTGLCIKDTIKFHHHSSHNLHVCPPLIMESNWTCGEDLKRRREGEWGTFFARGIDFTLDQSPRTETSTHWPVACLRMKNTEILRRECIFVFCILIFDFALDQSRRTETSTYWPVACRRMKNTKLQMYFCILYFDLWFYAWPVTEDRKLNTLTSCTSENEKYRNAKV